jgi:hypothetical protein
VDLESKAGIECEQEIPGTACSQLSAEHQTIQMKYKTYK